MTTTSEAEVIAALATETDEFEALRTRAAGMVNKMMTQADRILEAGTPADKAHFTKTVLPTILKALQDKKEGDDLAELRQEMADLMSEVREGLLSPRRPEDQVVPRVPVDGDDPPAGEGAVGTAAKVTRPRTTRKAPPKTPRSKPRGSTAR